MTALLVGTALAVASLAYVLYPLFRADIAVLPAPVADAGRRESPVCERCGPRPERDADYCSNCGAALLR